MVVNPREASKEDAIDGLLNGILASRKISKKEAQDAVVDVAARWQAWRKRFAVYEAIPAKEYIEFKKWRNSKKLLMQQEKLLKALRAVDEFYANRAYISASHGELAAQQMEKILVALLKIELTKIEIAQERKLERIQRLDRKLEKRMMDLKGDRKESKELIAKEKFYQKMKDRNDLPHIKKFFHHHEKKLHFGKHITRADHVGTVAEVGFDTAPSIFVAVADVLGGLAEAAKSVLSGIPIVSSIATAFSSGLETAKAWAQHKSTTKKVLATLGLVVAVSVLVASAVALGLGISVLGGGLAVGLGISGLILSSVIPLAKKKATVANFKDKVKDLEKDIRGLKPYSDRLDNTEYHILLKKVEESFLQGLITDKEKDEAISLLNRNQSDASNVSRATLKFDSAIKKAIQAHDDVGLDEFLKNEKISKIQYLKGRLAKLEPEVKKDSIKLWNGAVCVLAAVLLCIPTPPTLIMGAILLGVTTAIGLVIKFDLINKIKNKLKPAKAEVGSKISNSDEKIRDRLAIDAIPRVEVNPAAPVVSSAATRAEVAPVAEVHPERRAEEKPGAFLRR